MEWRGDVSNINLYTKENIHHLEWPNNSQFEKNYLLPFIIDGATKYVANVETEFAILQVGKNIFPLTINDKQYESCYVCSPYNALILYSKEEMGKLKNKLLEFLLGNLADICGLALKSARINQVVSVNNWLLSTNLYPLWNGEEIKKITKFLITKFPDHVIMFRSLNFESNAALLQKFQQENYELIPSRQLYIFDRKKSDYSKHRNIERDEILLRETHYEIVPHEKIKPTDYSRITELYNQLYLDKYCHHNPHFTSELISLWHQHKLLTMQALRNQDGVLDGIVGCFDRHEVATIPLVGYDTNLPQGLGLYRMLMNLSLKHSSIHNLVLNASSGASDFKSNRGGIAHIEYSAIHIDHLSFYRKIIWKILNSLLTNLAIPLMKKYKL